MKKHIARALRKDIKMEFAAHHFVHHSKLAKEIAVIVNVPPEKVCYWCTTHEWRLALNLWHYPKSHSPFVDDFYEYWNTFNHIEGKWANLFEIPDMETVVDIPILGG